MSEEKNKLEIMSHNIEKMEDISHSQISLLDKVTHVLNDLMNNPDQDLENKLNEVYSNASKNADLIKEILDEYTMKYNESKNS